MKKKNTHSFLDLQKSTLTLLDHPQTAVDDRNRSAYTTITHLTFNAQP